MDLKWLKQRVSDTINNKNVTEEKFKTVLNIGFKGLGLQSTLYCMFIVK